MAAIQKQNPPVGPPSGGLTPEMRLQLDRILEVRKAVRERRHTCGSSCIVTRRGKRTIFARLYHGGSV